MHDMCLANGGTTTKKRFIYLASVAMCCPFIASPTFIVFLMFFQQHALDDAQGWSFVMYTFIFYT